MNEEIRIENLKAWYGGSEVLKGISMNIFKDKITAIIGPSGCGKSTFIRCLNRMHEVVDGGIVEGKIFIGDQNVYDPNLPLVNLRKKVGMIFQRPNVFPTLSIYDNVAAGLKLNGFKDKVKLKEIVEKSLIDAAIFDEVKDRLNNSPLSLSGGQQQRLCIARALAVQPEVLLLDEPTSALDPISTSFIEELLSDLKTKATIVIVTHNLQQALRLSDYTAFFLGGNLIEYDKTEELGVNPKNKLTNSYLSGNLSELNI